MTPAPDGPAAGGRAAPRRRLAWAAATAKAARPACDPPRAQPPNTRRRGSARQKPWVGRTKTACASFGAATSIGALALLLCSGPALAQALTLDLGGGDSLAGRSVSLLLLVTVLSILPGLAIMVTCFPFIVTVLSILRQAIGLQQAPPNMLIISLALFLTWFVMDPVFTEAWIKGIGPFTRNELDIPSAFQAASLPFRAFMSARLDPDTFANLDALRPRLPGPAAEAPLSLLVPAFLLSEIQRAFEIGFLVFLPFLVIDLVVSAILMSMGMMMVPPAVVSLPFKLAFFVVADGWSLLSSALVRSYGA